MTLSTLLTSGVSAHFVLWMTLSMILQSPAAGFEGTHPRVTSVDVSIPSRRLPIGIQWFRGHAVVANSGSGSISLLARESNDGNVEPVFRIAAEWKIASSLSDLAVVGDHMLVLDDVRHEVLLASFGTSSDSNNLKLTEIQSWIRVSAKPVAIEVSSDTRTIAVSSLWAREVTLASITGDGEAENVRQIEMPFAPRELLFLNDQTLIVADAFGGMLAVVDTRSGAIVKQKTINAHNIRGLCLSHDGRVLHVCHQTLNGEAFTTFEQVFWGVLMQNGLQSIPMTSLVPSNLTVRAERNDDGNAAKEDAERMEQEARSLERVSIGGSQSGTPTTYPLGSPSMGAGDPGKMVVTRSDTTMILLSGVNAMAFRMASHLPFSRLKVGTCPTDVCTDSAEELALVVNRFADTVSVISLQGPEPKVVQTLTLGVMRPITAAERGQQLFYDASLSLDGWYSCHSCHTDGHTNGLLSDTVGDEGQGAPKLVLSLLGAGDTGPWAWLGTKSTLESQIESSLIVSMQSQLDTDDLPVHDLAEFVRTLEPAPSVFAARHSDVVRTEKDPHRQGNIKRSRQLFETLGCADCHADDRLTSGHTFDVGIQDETGHSEFNPPSLRGISQRNRFFHDGRATSLADVLRSGHPGKWRDPSESKGSPGAAADQLSGSLTAEQISLVLDLLNRL